MSQPSSPNLMALFLRALIPDQGFKCGVVIRAGKVSQFFVSTVEELADRLATENAKGGCNVYHACSSYADKSNRKARNALGSKAFWLDVDVGDNKPYKTMEQALAALGAFTLEAKLPLGSVVSSGHGIHVYWFAKEPWTPEEWGTRAASLKRLCSSHGFHADPARTCDPASILRPPESHNRKSELSQLPVRLLSFGGIHTRDHYEVLAGPAVPVSRPTPSVKKLSGLAADLANIHSEEPADADTIADRCKQIRDFRNTGGNIPEPQWYGAMAVIGRCEGGNGRVHDWSSGDPRYDQVQTDQKLVRALSLSGPTTCAHFASINAAGCAGCPFAGRVVTPLQLGRAVSGGTTHVAALGTGGQSSGADDAPVEPTNVLFGDRPAPIPQVPGAQRLPFGFKWGIAGQLQFVSEGTKGEEKEMTVCAFPLYLAAVGTGELRTDAFSVTFKHWLPKEGWRGVVLAAKDVFGPACTSLLAERGVILENAELFRKYVRDSMAMFHADSKLGMQYEQFGWKDNETSFLLGDKLYTPDGIKTVPVSHEVMERGKQLIPDLRGSLEAWSKAASFFAAQGLEMHLYGILAAFAAPLVRFLSADEGGGILSYVTASSGRGKTSVLEAVSSVWGKLDGLRLITNDTKISKGILLGTLGNMPMVFDEFDTADPDHVRDFVSTFTTGRDKLRATQAGELKQSGARWQTLLVIASNRSLVDAILAAKNTAQTYRIMELNTEQNDLLKASGDRIRQALRDNAGWAGDKYLKYLVAPGVIPAIRQKMEAYQIQLQNAPWYQSEYRFWVRMHVAIAIAAQIVERLDLITFSSLRILRWGEEFISKLGESNDQNVPAAAQQSTEILGEFLDAYRSEILIMDHEWRAHSKTVPRYLPPLRISGRVNRDTRLLFIGQAQLRQYVTVTKRFPWREFCKTLEKPKIIMDKRNLVLGAGTDLAGAQVMCVQFDLDHPALTGVVRVIEGGIKSNIVEMRR